MTDETPPHDSGARLRDRRAYLDGQIQALMELMAHFRSELLRITEVLKKEPSKGEEARKVINNLGTLMKFALEQDEKIHEFDIARTGPAGDFALDLDEARIAIGKRLSELRRAQGSGQVS